MDAGTPDRKAATNGRGHVSGNVMLRVVAIVAIAIASSFARPDLGRAEPPSLILIGDSVTAGWGASDARHAWPTLLGRFAQVDATPGAASGDFLDRSWAATTVVVELGINDFAQGVSPASYGDHMRRILANVSAARVILVLPYRIGREGSSPWSAYEDELSAIAQSDRRAVLVDLGPFFGGPTTAYLAPDLVHPNDNGHALIARLVSEVLAT